MFGFHLGHIAVGWHPLVKFCLNWSYRNNTDIIYLCICLCLERLMLINFVTTTSTSAYIWSNTTMAFSWNKRVVCCCCFVLFLPFFFSTVSICTDNMHLLLLLMWRLRFLTEMLTKEFCLGLKLQFAEAAYGQRIQDYFSISSEKLKRGRTLMRTKKYYCVKHSGVCVCVCVRACARARNVM